MLRTEVRVVFWVYFFVCFNKHTKSGTFSGSLKVIGTITELTLIAIRMDGNLFHGWNSGKILLCELPRVS